MRYLYTFIFYLILPIILARLYWRGRKLPLYRQRWKERFGHFDSPPLQQSFWIHAVSYGEVVAAEPLVNALIVKYPSHPIVMTCMTATGSERIQKSFGNSVTHCYVPYDVPHFIKRFLRHFNPTLAIMMETELWPNILYHCKKQKIPVLLANARLSPRSAQRIKRWQRFLGFIWHQPVCIAAQSKSDALRFQQVGVPLEKINIVGNLKFDITLSDALLQSAKEIRRQWVSHRYVWIAASTHSGEEEKILKSFLQVSKNISQLLLVLVPRHPERFDQVESLCEKMGFNLVKRSKNELPQENTHILLADTMGELCLFYAAADVAFVGGSLVDVGGHNLLEPASAGVPIITGPYLQNVNEVSELLKNAKALNVVADTNALASAVLQLLKNQALRFQQIKNAQQVVLQNQGSVEKHLQWIDKLQKA